MRYGIVNIDHLIALQLIAMLAINIDAGQLAVNDQRIAGACATASILPVPHTEELFVKGNSNFAALLKGGLTFPEIYHLGFKQGNSLSLRIQKGHIHSTARFWHLLKELYIANLPIHLLLQSQKRNIVDISALMFAGGQIKGLDIQDLPPGFTESMPRQHRHLLGLVFASRLNLIAQETAGRGDDHAV